MSRSSPDPPGDDPRVARTREAVRAAIRRLLAASGLDAVTHQRVAEAAGVGRASVYRHWPTRSDLLLDALAAAASPAPVWTSSGEVAADLRAELRRIRAVLYESDLLPQIVALVGRAEWEPELRALKHHLVDHASRPLRVALEAGVARGELPADLDPRTALAQLAGPLFFRRLLTDEPVDEATIDELVDSFLARA